MTLLRQHRLATFLLAVLGIVAFAISQLDFALLFLGVFLAMLSWYVTEGPRGRTLPDWLANLAIAAIFGWSLLGFLGEGSLEGAMGALKSARDPDARRVDGGHRRVDLRPGQRYHRMTSSMALSTHS